jgi:rhodanese-related sulfurtransferase
MNSWRERVIMATESVTGIARISAKQLYELYQSGKPVELIDVRTPAEYRSLHATIATLVPLDELNPKKFMETCRGTRHDPLYVICRSGTRSEKACERFFSAGYTDVVNVTGGTLAWEQAGLPVVRGKKMLPLDRQVQVTAGTMALAGFSLGEFVNPNCFLLAGFVGCGLVFAGVTGFCPLGWVIAKMPWNQAGRDDACCSR